VANGIGNAVGVRHTETSLIVWIGEIEKETTEDKKAEVAPIFSANQFYDAGDKGCAAGPMDDIAGIMGQMSAGQTLEIFATDAAVSADLSAWCRMTGHQLLEQQNNHYLLQHK
jgi:TusA-related sulfurtransferase